VKSKVKTDKLKKNKSVFFVNIKIAIHPNHLSTPSHNILTLWTKRTDEKFIKLKVIKLLFAN